jgi:hypothetical protein
MNEMQHFFVFVSLGHKWKEFIVKRN